MKHALKLESFASDDAAAQGPSPEFMAGHAAGEIAGRLAASAASDIADAALVQALTDMQFTYAEARGEILRSLSGLISTICEKVLPQCVEDGFPRQISDMIMAQVARDQPCTMQVTVHPDQVDAIARTLAPLAPAILVQPDARLTRHAAWVGAGAAETLLDLDQLLADISDRMAMISPSTSKETNHG